MSPALAKPMVRLSVPPGIRLNNARQLDRHAAGTECNVLAVLAQLGWRAGWLSGLPPNSLGEFVRNELQKVGVDLTAVVWSDRGRMGSYYVEMSVPPRPIQVIYDRANTCISQLKPEDIDWEYLLDTEIIHLTGITPPLSAGCSSIVKELVQRARQNDVALSFDVNYRAKLWSETEAAEALLPLMQAVEVLFCSLRDAVRLFGCEEDAKTAVQQLATKSAAKKVVITQADKGVIGWDGSQIYQQQALPVQIIDRIGAGDALAAGVLHGWLQNDFVTGLKYGTILAALALSQHGDIVLTSKEELTSLLVHGDKDVLR